MLPKALEEIGQRLVDKLSRTKHDLAALAFFVIVVGEFFISAHFTARYVL